MSAIVTRSSALATLLTLVLACLVGASPAGAAPAAPGPAHAAPAGKPLPGTPWASGERRAGRVPPATDRAGARGLRAASTADLSPCEEDDAFLCTTVPVPLDRRDPDGRTVDIAVAVFPHTGDQPTSDGAVLVTCGGPGCSATLFPKYGFSFFLLPEIAETRDLVFVDQRGVGLSDVIDCPELQEGILGELYSSARLCHDQLGDAANLYSTTDVADDLEDVRVALGYDQVDVFGGSYAGVDMITYAVRHPDAIRSIVLASPAMVVGVDPFYPQAPTHMPDVTAGVCGRSPACAAAHPHPRREFAAVARHLREHPATYLGTDSAGDVHRVRLSENLMSNFFMYFNGAHFTGPGELLPAFRALRHGDTTPVMRLAADNDPGNGFGADLREFSNGHSVARTCVDSEPPWDKDAARAVRHQQYDDAYAAEPSHYGPISKEAWAAPDWRGWQPLPCISSRWEDRPMYPAGTTVDGIPTLVLGGEYDLPVPESVSKLALDVMTDSTYVGMKAAGHDPQFWSDCGPRIVQRFYRTHGVGNAACADRPAGGWWVPGSFPRHVAGAPVARQVDGAPASRALRRLVTATVWTAFDSVFHNFFVPGDSVALRGGVVDFEPTDFGAQWTLRKARFTRDLVIRGVVADGPGKWRAHLRASLDGDRTRVRFSGHLLESGAVVTVHARGRTFTVPAY
jgi:pimeloyl-ACP methyl ester carboxylesterase